jgi:hypothetical protein
MLTIDFVLSCDP